LLHQRTEIAAHHEFSRIAGRTMCLGERERERHTLKAIFKFNFALLFVYVPEDFKGKGDFMNAILKVKRMVVLCKNL
jgi:hypothetical protein